MRNDHSTGVAELEAWVRELFRPRAHDHAAGHDPHHGSNDMNHRTEGEWDDAQGERGHHEQAPQPVGTNRHDLGGERQDFSRAGRNGQRGDAARDRSEWNT